MVSGLLAARAAYNPVDMVESVVKQVICVMYFVNGVRPRPPNATTFILWKMIL